MRCHRLLVFTLVAAALSIRCHKSTQATATAPSAVPASATPAAPAVSPTPAPVSPIPGTLQAEAATSKSGGRAIQRGSAQGALVWHLDKGQELSFELSGIREAAYSVAIRYSNDDGGVGDTVEILVDGVLVRSMHTADSGSRGYGYDWDTFVVSEPVALGTLTGKRTITFRVTTSDGYGVDLDACVFTA